MRNDPRPSTERYYARQRLLKAKKSFKIREC